MNRRNFVSLTIGITAAPICAELGWRRVTANETGLPHWGYTGDDGPEHWAQLSPSFAACGRGMQQSPVDLRDADVIHADVGTITFNYYPTPLRIINNGHTVQVNYEPGSTLVARGITYQITQFHFHTPSEHTRNGIHTDMELHIVHQNEAKQLAVVGVLLERGAANEALDQIWRAMPTEIGQEKTVSGVSVNVASMLPSYRGYFEYLGSLTTPPCSEGVRWIVLARPVHLSQEQVASFRKLMPTDARPTQNLDQRFVLEQL